MVRASTPHTYKPPFSLSLDVHFAVVILTPYMYFSTIDLDSDYYSPRCKDLNGLWLFKAVVFFFFFFGFWELALVTPTTLTGVRG
jgi:hypothetical protein